MRGSTASRRDINYVAGGLTLNAAAAYTDAKTKGNICDVADRPMRPIWTRLIRTRTMTEIRTSSSRRQGRACRSRRSSRSPRRRAMPGMSASGKAHVQVGFVHQSSAPIGHLTDRRCNDLRQAPGIDPGRSVRRLQLAQFQFELFGTNIFDERNELSRFVVCGICTPPVHQIVPGRPRTIGLRAGMKF